MKIRYIILYSLLLIVSSKTISQTNSLSSSPYSLSGLGLQNQVSTGKTNGLGKSGIAMPSDSFINNSNPASFGAIPQNSFFYDFGFKGETNTSQEGSNENSNIIANFSNIAIAFPLTKKSGLSFTLTPFTSVGYTIEGIETSIEGSSNLFSSIIEGEGGINDFKINYGYSLTNKFRLGLSGSVLFGKIIETETNYIFMNSLSSVLIDDDSHYSGFRLGSGFQYDINKNISIGGIINLTTTLKGDKIGTVTIHTETSTEVIDIDTDIDDFKLPLEIGFGVQSKFIDFFVVNLDYKKSFWDNTNQSDQIGTFVDQNSFGFGLEYSPTKNYSKFFNRLDYRVGLNYDDGNLAVGNNYERVNNYALNLGFGVPLRQDSNSMINFSYSYGNKGQLSSGLIKENYHLFSINLSLEGIWFQKRKYN